MNDELVDQIIMEEAIKLASKRDFKLFTTAKLRENCGIVDAQDFKNGMQVGYTLGMIEALFEKRYSNKLHEIIDDYIKKI